MVHRRQYGGIIMISIPHIGAIASAFKQAASATDPYFSSVVLLMHGENNLLDSSSKNRTITTVGTVTTPTTQPLMGVRSIYFSGFGNRLKIDSTADFTFGTSDFTIECIIYLTGGSGTDRALFDFRPNEKISPFTFFIDRKTNKLAMWDGTFYGGTGSLISLNTTYHIAFVRYSGVITAYTNGVSQWTISTAKNFSSSYPLGIAGNYETGTSNLIGYIDEYRITKGIARYTSNFTPPTSQFPDS